MADGLAHPPDLAVAALVDHETQEVGRHQAGLGRRGAAVGQVDALPQLAQRRPGWASPCTWARYSFSTPNLGMGQPVGQLTVVGEDEQPLGVLIEAADGEHPGLRRAPARRRWGDPVDRRPC